jgi:hypothetical protein
MPSSCAFVPLCGPKMKQIAHWKSIVRHDYLPTPGTSGSHSPKAAKSVARHRCCRAAMDISLRCKGPRARTAGIWLGRARLTLFHVGYHRVVGVLQSRSSPGASRRSCASGDCTRWNVAIETRLDVAPVVICLRDPRTIARVRYLGGRHARTFRSSPASNNGSDDSARVRRVAACATGWYQRRSQREIRLAVGRKRRRTTPCPDC